MCLYVYVKCRRDFNVKSNFPFWLYMWEIHLGKIQTFLFRILKMKRKSGETFFSNKKRKLYYKDKKKRKRRKKKCYDSTFFYRFNIRYLFVMEFIHPRVCWIYMCDYATWYNIRNSLLFPKSFFLHIHCTNTYSTLKLKYEWYLKLKKYSAVLFRSVACRHIQYDFKRCTVCPALENNKILFLHIKIGIKKN